MHCAMSQFEFTPDLLAVSFSVWKMLQTIRCVLPTDIALSSAFYWFSATWAARYNTHLLISVTLKLPFSFLVLSLAFACRYCSQGM